MISLRWPLLALLALVLAGSNCDPCRATDRAASGALSKIVELYRIRVAAAQLELKSDEIRLQHARTKHDRMVGLGSAVSRQTVCDAKLEVDLLEVELETDRNSIQEAQLHLNLIREGIDCGAVNLDDLRIPTELLRPRH